MLIEKKKKSASRLTTVFYTNFFLLIVIPILLTVLAATAVTRSIMLESAKEKIQLAHENVAMTLKNEINDATLRLSQFVLVNDSTALNLASQINQTTGQKKYELTGELKQQFNLMVTPKSDILAIHLYYKDNNVLYFKDELAESIEDLRRTDWYQGALETPDRTHVGTVQSTITYKSLRTENAHMTLAIAFAPKEYDELGEVEMVCLYANTQVGKMIPAYSEDVAQGKMYLVDQEGRVLVAPSEESTDNPIPESISRKPTGTYQLKENGNTMSYIVSEIPASPQWRVISEISNNAMLRDFNRIAAIVLAVSILLFLLFIVYSLIFLKKIIQPINHLIAGMAQVEKGDLQTHLVPSGQKEMRTLVHSFNQMVRRMKELMVRKDKEEKERYQAEIKALQSQINPHFLVNTLNSIRFMAMVAKFDSIKNMAEALMKILSASFRHSAGLYTVAEEVEMLESYVYLMKIRYSDNFTVRYEIDTEVLDCMVPRLILQPIVENCIVHGFEDMMEIGIIRVHLCIGQNCLLLMIEDNGCGISDERIAELLSKDPQPSQQHGIGLANVNRRIQLTFGKGFGMQMEQSCPNGLKTILKLPVRRVEKENGLNHVSDYDSGR